MGRRGPGREDRTMNPVLASALLALGACLALVLATVRLPAANRPALDADASVLHHASHSGQSSPLLNSSLPAS